MSFEANRTLVFTVREESSTRRNWVVYMSHENRIQASEHYVSQKESWPGEWLVHSEKIFRGVALLSKTANFAAAPMLRVVQITRL